MVRRIQDSFPLIPIAVTVITGLIVLFVVTKMTSRRKESFAIRKGYDQSCAHKIKKQMLDGNSKLDKQVKNWSNKQKEDYNKAVKECKQYRKDKAEREKAAGAE